jgi:hypothetical protein
VQKFRLLSVLAVQLAEMAAIHLSDPMSGVAEMGGCLQGCLVAVA